MNLRGAISTAEICCCQPLASRRAYSWSLEDWYCCVRNRVLHTLVLVSVVCALLFLSYKQNKKVRPARLFRWSRLPAQSVFFVHMSFNRIVCMTFALSHCSCSCSLMCCRLSPLWPWHHVVCVAVFSLCSVLQSYVRLYSRRYRGHVHRLSQGFGPLRKPCCMCHACCSHVYYTLSHQYHAAVPLSLL